MKAPRALAAATRSWCRRRIGLGPVGTPQFRRRHAWAFAGVGLLLLGACVTSKDALFVPSQIPGATFVGSDECVTCHSEIAAGFTARADHARLTVRGANAVNIGCEACHGPGSAHAEAGGTIGTIVNPRKSPAICYQCHLDKAGQFRSLPYHHPVEEGQVGCGDCHNPHGVSLVKSGGTSSDHIDSTCFKCHAAQRGPFVFEHEALREGCETCHDPHGTVNAKLLKQRDANLCLKCHLQQRTPTGVVIGGFNHSANLARGTCWTAGCHEAVHGSQVNRSLRF